MSGVTTALGPTEVAQPASSPSRWKIFLGGAIIALAALAAYHNCYTVPFLLDDLSAVVDNSAIRHLWPLWPVVTHTSRPVVHLSLAVNYALGGLNPWGYHLLNVIIHILAALTLYGVVQRTRLPARSPLPWLAAMIAVIWVVHPLQTESVTYIIQRCESLMGLFYLLTLYCVIRSNGSSRRVWWETGAVVSCALAMGCKPVAATAPVVVALYDRAFLVGSWREILRRRWKLYAALAATWLLLPLLLANGPRDWKESAGFGYRNITPVQYALTQPAVIVHYLRLAFWPRSLCLDYAWPVARTAHEVWPGLIVVGALLAVTVWGWRRKPALGFLGAWFFIILAPTSSFIPIADLAFEHRMYLSLAAVVTFVVIGIDALLGRRSLPVFLALAVGLAVLTTQRNEVYRTDLSIWNDTVAKSPGNGRAHNYVGRALIEIGQLPEAMKECEEALRINPDDPEAHGNLGVILQLTGKTPEAIAEYEQALRLNPDLPEAHYNLGLVLEKLGRTPEAIAQYKDALRLRPDHIKAHANLGNALLQMGIPSAAIVQLQQALQLKPENVEAHVNLGTALMREGQIARAAGEYEAALRLNPDSAEAHSNLGAILQRAGKLPEAIAHYERAVHIKPDYVEAHYNFGLALEKLGRRPEAIEQFEQALKLRPDFPAAKKALTRLQAGP